MSQRLVKSANPNNKPGNINFLISRTDREEVITKCRRAPNNKVYKSFTFQNMVNEAEPPKRELK